MRKILATLLSTVLLLTFSAPAFALENYSFQAEYNEFTENLLEAKLAENYILADSYIEKASPELMSHYYKTADAFNSEKVNEKLKDLKIGPNESVLVILDDNSFVEVTTTTKPIEIGNSFEKKHGGITTMDYTSDYDMSGTRWNTEYKYEVGFNSATLILNTYYEIGSKMYIYDTDTSGTEGSLGISVTSSTSVSNNNTATATAKGTYNLKKLGGSTETYTLYTEVGFLGSFVDPYGYHYVSYYTDSWKS